METSSSLTHLNAAGNLRMVDIGGKAVSARRAVAFGSIRVGPRALKLLLEQGGKGDAWTSSRVAGVLAAKKTPELIPLTHPIKLDSVLIHLAPLGDSRVVIFADVLASDRTGAEMEAMVAVSAALLNLYDMTKSVEKGIVIENTRLLLKTGGKSGVWVASDGELGQVEKLAISEKKGVPKTPRDSAFIRVGFGVEGDAHGGDWHRQVSLLGLESIKKMQEKGLKVDFGAFAENVATSGLSLYQLPIGSLLLSREGVILEITQIGKECHTRCAIYHQAGDCVMPREGIFARVLAGGTLSAGDSLLAVKNPLTSAL